MQKSVDYTRKRQRISVLGILEQLIATIPLIIGIYMLLITLNIRVIVIFSNLLKMLMANMSEWRIFPKVKININPAEIFPDTNIFYLIKHLPKIIIQVSINTFTKVLIIPQSYHEIGPYILNLLLAVYLSSIIFTGSWRLTQFITTRIGVPLPKMVQKQMVMVFKPLHLQWVTIQAFEIIKCKEKHLPLLTLLSNRSNIIWKTVVQLQPETEDSQVLVIVSQKRRFIPVPPSTLRSRIESFLLGHEILVEPVPAPRFPKMRYLSDVRGLPYLSNLVRTLQNQHAQVLTVVELRYKPSRKAGKVSKEGKKVNLSIYKTSVGFFSPSIDIDFVIGSLLFEGGLRRRRFMHLDGSNIKKLTKLPLVDKQSSFSKLVDKFSEEDSKLQAVPSKNNRYEQHTRLYMIKSFIIGILRPIFDIFRDITGSSGAEFANINEIGLENGEIPYSVTLEDLAQGGIIAGAIGTGKTTLRLHLMRIVKASGARYIDFDLKGDATQYNMLVEGSEVYIPKENFSINPFQCPEGFTKREYADLLTSAFVDTIPHSDALSPPQMSLLVSAVQKTVDIEGNARDFFKNILLISEQERQVLDNNQNVTAQALLVRFHWMKTSLADIFWKESSTIDENTIAGSSILFDLSKLASTATHAQIRFVINLLTARIMASFANKPPVETPELVMFVDEAQILLPKGSTNGDLSKIEETVATLRYKGVSVVAAGISAAMMSPVLLDVGFVAQFRSESRELLRALTVFGDKQDLIPQLPPYSCVIRSRAKETALVRTHPFENKSTGHEDTIKHSPRSFDQQISHGQPVFSENLEDFSLNFENIWISKLDALFSTEIDLDKFTESLLQASGSKFAKKQLPKLPYEDVKVENVVNLAVKKLQSRYDKLYDIQKQHIRAYLLLIMRAYLLRLVISLKYDSKLNIVDRNLPKLFQTVVSTIDSHTVSLTEEYGKVTNHNFG